MNKEEKTKRIIQAINETERQIEKATKRYDDSVKCLEMDKAEYPDGNHSAWIEYCNQDKERVDSLKSHRNKLYSMLREVA